MTRFHNFLHKLWMPVAASMLAVLISGSTAQTPPAMPTVDLSVGPVAINAQAVNIALALSVEFPTLGAAYRSTSYDATQTYVGYWDSKGCYTYFDETDGSSESGQYFRRTGTVDADGSCNVGSASGQYSGNVLNYAATSSIDLLRYALTGGNRVVDTATNTVLARAYLPADFRSIHQGSGGYWPEKQVPASLVGKVTPKFANPSGSGFYNGTVYFNSCDDRIYVGNSTTGGDCDNPSNANIFGPSVPNLSGSYTTQGFVTTPADTTSTTYVSAGTAYWDRTQPNVTQTYAPSGSDPLAGTLDPNAMVVTPTPRNLSVVISTSTSAQYAGDAVAGVIYVATNNTSTTAPVAAAENPPIIRGYRYPGSGTTSVAPPTAAESPAVIRGYYRTGGTTTVTPPTAAENPASIQGYMWSPSGQFAFSYQGNGAPTNTQAANRYDWVCYDSTAPYIIRLGPQSSRPTCPAGQTRYQYTDNQSSNRRYYTYYTGTPYYRAYAPFYRAYVPYYKVYTATNYYNHYQQVPTWYQASVYTVYKVYGNTQGKMKASVQVCVGDEASSRSDLCRRYPDGNYKPIGEVQVNATGVRLAAFGYLADDTTSRYGGVLRAPMKYPGPTYTDPNGQPQTNSASEWNANNGVFASDPLGASPTYTLSGVINYLNKFGTTGTKGNYKGYDPVGELYYEALRYFQGLGPTAAAASGLDSTLAEGYPVYTSWQDPVQNACERSNYILVIGDVNTHYDKQLPGHNSTTGVNETSTDPVRSAEPLLGTSTVSFNAITWTDLLTAFETGASKTYTAATGAVQNTTGNPNINSNNADLSTKQTGSSGRSAYYWAGAAYWANTQPIRFDTKSGQSMKDIRVKTFTIDVDEGGNGLIDGNTRSSSYGRSPRDSSFYLAGKYGWFSDANLDGNPFRTAGGVNSNKEWEDPLAPNTPDGYVIASQAQKMIAGIRKFFGATSAQRGAVSVSAISSARYTADAPNGDFFAPQFNAADWSGTVMRSSLVLNTETGTVESTPNVIWDAGAILTSGSWASGTTTLADPYQRPADRKIITMATVSGATTGVLFDVANKNQLDSAILAALNTNPISGATDNLADQRINWLRGDHGYELSSTGGALRRRASVMGDVINSGPVYKQAADPRLSGTGYLAFAQSVLNRGAVIYVGANDGMMHAFRATDGKELFAYIPRAVAPYLNKLTHPSYTHRPYVDGVAQVGEAQVGSNWKTLLVSGMGGGAQGVFALDVTHPESFGVNNVMFEFTDADDPDMGNVLTQPALVKLMVPGATPANPPTYKWFIAVGSGYNNYKADGHASANGAQALFFLSVDKAAGTPWTEGTNYYKVTVPVAQTSAVNGLVNPGFTGTNGVTKLLYAGDLQGNMWKFDLSDGINNTTIASAVLSAGGTRKPLFVATDSVGTRQPITTAPQIIEANTEGYMVVFGTGKFVEPSDTSTAGQQAIYGIWDSMETSASAHTVPRDKLYQRSSTLSGASVTLGTGTFVYGMDNGQYRGWYFNLPQTRERVSVESALGVGAVIFAAAIPEGTCSGDGSGRKYCVNPVTGMNVCFGDATSTLGIPSGPKIFQIELSDSSYSARSPSGRRTVTIEQQAVSSSTRITDAGNALVAGQKLVQITIPAGRLNWRELRN
ncbi:MAG: hypothetical protein KA254_02140 [Rhodoferax sp.]|nr:hypothetical protein [Rhodoferax sp.]